MLIAARAVHGVCLNRSDHIYRTTMCIASGRSPSKVTITRVWESLRDALINRIQEAADLAMQNRRGAAGSCHIPSVKGRAGSSKPDCFDDVVQTRIVADAE